MRIFLIAVLLMVFIYADVNIEKYKDPNDFLYVETKNKKGWARVCKNRRVEVYTIRPCGFRRIERFCNCINNKKNNKYECVRCD